MDLKTETELISREYWRFPLDTLRMNLAPPLRLGFVVFLHYGGVEADGVATLVMLEKLKSCAPKLSR